MAEINTQTIESSELPDDVTERGLLESRAALEHAVAWKSHVTVASYHLKRLLKSAQATRVIPEVYERLNDEMKAKLEESLVYMARFSKELETQIKDADDAFDGLYKELQQRAAMIAWKVIEEEMSKGKEDK